MKMLKLYITVCIVSLFAVSCNDENTKEIINNADYEILEGNILKFKDQATFDRYVNDDVEIDGHYSLYNNYEEAMNEAESYYDREGGYEEFKTKYSSLYFPEYENDYSAFLPVSRKSVALFLNLNGEVIIGDEKQNLIDINSPKQLVELGLLKVDGIKTYAREKGPSGHPLNGLDEIHYNDRKLWVNVDSKPCPDPTCVQMIVVEVCFRKKGFLGAWYNYKSETNLYNGSALFGYDYDFSSHDYRIPRAWGVPVPPFRAIMGVQFQGFGGVAGDQIFYFEIAK